MLSLTFRTSHTAPMAHINLHVNLHHNIISDVNLRAMTPQPVPVTALPYATPFHYFLHWHRLAYFKTFLNINKEYVWPTLAMATMLYAEHMQPTSATIWRDKSFGQSEHEKGNLAHHFSSKISKCTLPNLLLFRDNSNLKRPFIQPARWER